VESLIGLLGDPDTWTQNRAAQALTQIGTPAAGALTKLLADIAQYPWVRNATVDVLAEIGESSIIDLVRMLNAKDEIVRRSVIQVLERIASRAVEPLTEALKDIDEDTRRTAVWVLKSMRNRRAVEPLVSVLESRDGYRQRRRNGCSTEVNRGEKEEMGQ
jgi:HEAT repeat protein